MASVKQDAHYACLYFDEDRVLSKGEIYGMGGKHVVAQIVLCQGGTV